jgi:chemotaxis signal transduction protein
MSIDQIDLGTLSSRSYSQLRPDIAVHVELANVDLLVVEVGGCAYALRIAELTTVQRTGSVAPFTHGGRACAGVTDVNGRIVVVHDLGQLLGHQPPTDHSFIAVSRFDPHVGVVMPPVDAYVRVPGAAVTRNGLPGTDARIATIEHEGRALTLLDLERLLFTH